MAKRQFYMTLFLLIAVDQATKYWASIFVGRPIGDPKFLSVALYKNYGIAFSVLNHSPNVALWVSVLGVLFFYFLFRMHYNRTIALIFLLSGALGNLLDRILWGYVIDWFYVGVYINIADVLLCFGVFLLVMDLFLNYVGGHDCE